MNVSRTDKELEMAVREELAWDARIDDSCIDVDVNDGVVTLAGSVGSHGEKMAAIEGAQVFGGAHELLVELDIVSDEERNPSDDELSQIVRYLLAWDALVPSQHVAVGVEDGVVTLRGSVATEAQRREVERAIRNVIGIQGITDEIVVAQANVALEAVRAALNTALVRRAQHQAKHIDVTIDGSCVTLRGRVSTPADKRAVVGAVAHAPGISEVRDEMLIEPVELYR